MFLRIFIYEHDNKQEMLGILSFGDSVTFGRGDNVSGGWVGRLKKYFEAKDYYNALFNLGIPGDTSSGILKRIGIESDARIDNTWKGSKFVYIIGIGTNDIRFVGGSENQFISSKKFEKNIMKIIEIAKKYSRDIIFLGIPPVDEEKTKPYEGDFYLNNRIEEFNNIIRACCRDEEIYFLDMYDQLINLNYKNLLGDGIHPNAEGYEKMYELIKGFLMAHKIID